MDLPMSVGADGDAGGGVVCDAHRCYPHILNTPALRGLTGVGESVGRADRCRRPRDGSTHGQLIGPLAVTQ
jgi:hypothetical protein